MKREWRKVFPVICPVDRKRLQAVPPRLQDASAAIDRKGIEEGEMHAEAFSGDKEPEA